MFSGIDTFSSSSEPVEAGSNSADSQVKSTAISLSDMVPWVIVVVTDLSR